MISDEKPSRLEPKEIKQFTSDLIDIGEADHQKVTADFNSCALNSNKISYVDTYDPNNTQELYAVTEDDDFVPGTQYSPEEPLHIRH